jgi:tRNA-dihydrouridine synthase A
MKTLVTSVNIPCTVKCRLGVDNLDSYEFVRNFIEIVHKEGGVTHFVMHARKAYLKGLNPHENRTVPPLRYDWGKKLHILVYELKKEFPHI